MHNLNGLLTFLLSGFPASLACSLILTLLLGGLQALVLPRTTILLLLFLTAFIWIAVILMLLLAVRLRYQLLYHQAINIPYNHDYVGVSSGTYLVHFCYDLQLPSSPSSLSTPWLKSMWWVAHWERLGIYSTLILPFDFSSLVSESLWRVACQNQVPRSRITRATDGALFLTTSSSHACWGEATIYKTES